MTELKVQRAVLWLVMLMGIACLPLGIMELSFWWATMLGFVITVGSAFGAWRVSREIKATRAFEQTVMSETIFRQEIARTGRLDAAQQAIAQAKPRRRSPFGTKMRA
ncbi:MAG TPA: hypothetical protein VN808_04390 [Stellaceae bacterium]|nr:hypothetical protein [Stellaceae bacterium]